MKIKWNKMYVLLLFSILILLSTPVFGLETQNYKMLPDAIAKTIKIGSFLDVPITINNYQDSAMRITVSTEGEVGRIIKLDKSRMSIEPKATDYFTITLIGENISYYSGSVVLSGDMQAEIGVNVTVSDTAGVPVEAVAIEIDPMYEKVSIGDVLKYKVSVNNLLGRPFNITLSHSIDQLGKESTHTFEKAFFEETESIELNASYSSLKEYRIPEFIRHGDFVITVKAVYLGLESTTSRRIYVTEPIMDYLIFGILPVRWVLLVSTFLLLCAVGFLIYLKRTAKKKRYVAKVDYNLLPKPGPRSAYMGKIAETDKKAYFDIDQLTTHTLVAGSTGGGKTVSTEVLVEEAIMKGVAIIVFDPTAQWTGMLRKCQEKKMLNIYKKFGLKKTDARAFNGNIKQITNAREVIDIKKFMKQGEINVFSISKLDPEDADILVATTVRQVFHANLPESPELKLLIVFDEVHRLLPKFGGSGEGFIQIERACREFRKWGVGLILISQVLSDFVGETKANINTEIQMRTRDQGDLDRIKNKYGGYMLQSLLKSSTGTGMIENSAYNKGNPYFVAFRPLLHEHARLSDDELENYNKYNSLIDDLEYQIEQLEKEGLDVFDLKLELKMALDKVKSGSFNMVNIYLEGLTPRIQAQWDKLGKKPKKREVQLVSEAELRADIEKAKASRKDYEDKEKSGSIPSRKAKQEIEPLRLKSGIVVTKLTELIDAIGVMDSKTFNEHVNSQKNDFSDWVKKSDPALGEKLGQMKSKEEIKKALESYQAEKDGQ